MENSNICKQTNKQHMIYLQDNPEAKLEDLEKPGVDDEPQQVLLRYVKLIEKYYLVFYSCFEVGKHN